MAPQVQEKKCPSWGYSSCDEWAKHYPVGSHQSPINILVSNYDQLIQSTCCNHQNNNNNANSINHNHHHHHHKHVISERMASLYLNGSQHVGNNNKLGARRVVEKHRAHLDSVGDDQHPRSSSTCSSASAQSASGSSCPPSPIGGQQQQYYDGDNSDSDSSPLAGLDLQEQQEVQRTRYCTSNHKIFLGYPRYLSSMQLCNTGHGWQVSLPAELASHTLVSGPPFGDREYRLAQLHCHWGESCDRGSEHLINGCSFAAEIHFVHWNCTDFSSMEEASKHKHGLAVLGVMVQALEGEQNRNKHLDKIAQALKRVERPGERFEVSAARLDLKKLFPANRWSYASYEGSLTTPPLSEVVDWVVFLNPIQCSSSQIEQFRQLRCEEETMGAGCLKLIKNHRPVQPHNGRLVSIWTHH